LVSYYINYTHSNMLVCFGFQKNEGEMID